jgi:predicted phage tail protein
MSYRRTLVLPAAAAFFGLACPALAEPALPQLPADGAVVGTLRPTFAWTPGSSGVPIARYEVFVETPVGALKVADAAAGTLTATSSVDLPDDGRYRWFVRLVNALGGVASTPVDARAQVAIATPAAAPTLVDGPSGTTGVDAPVFAWIGSRSSSHWVVQDDAGAQVQSGDSPTGGGRATLAELPDGAYVFRVAQTSSAGIEGAAVARAFTVDSTPPPAPSPTASGSGQTRTTPAFSWRNTDPGAVATWRVRASRGVVVSGPSDTTLTNATPPPLTPGAYVFEVRQTDAAGNVGAWGSEPFSIVPSVAVPAIAGARRATGAPAAVRLLRRNTRLLRPAAGARIASARPLLRWRGGPARTDLYNLQLFRVDPRGRLIKEGGAFPSSRRYTLPRGSELDPGSCYVWRVWPYRAGGYTTSPLGTSDFCVRE